ncbi:MAG: mechanosensitive ion channel family protein [Acidobacteriaceae bacterium]
MKAFLHNGDYLHRLLITIAVLLIAFTILWLLLRLRRKAQRLLNTHRHTLPSIRFRGLEIVQKSSLRQAIATTISVLFLALVIFVVFSGSVIIFRQFPATESFANAVLQWIWKPLRDMGIGFLHYLPNLFYILVIAFVTRLILRAVGFVFGKAHDGSISLEPWIHQDVAKPTSQIFKALVIVVALFFIAPLIPGTGSSAAQGISVILGLMVSFGSTSTVGNIIAGVVLTYMRPFKIGDRVKIGDATGDVIERTFLYTKLLTIKNEEVIVPSLQAIGGNIINYSAQGNSGQLILHTTITIGYDAPWREVHKLLLSAAERTAGILKEPKPFVLQTSLDDFYVSYQINCYTDQPNRMASIYGELHQNIQDSFNEGGIEIMSAHYAQLRDGNATTIPAPHSDGMQPQRFQVDVSTSKSSQ